MTHVLQAQGLTKSYGSLGGEVHALRGIDLAVEAGEFVSVMGPSGCGKSTLLHLLGGLDRATSGTITLGGRRVEALGETAWALLRRREVAFVFQFFNLIPNLTVADNVELPALVAGVPPREARQRRTRLLEELGLSDRAQHVPARLSGGQQQRAAVARALVIRPTVLLADEPTGNLDGEATRDVVRLLREQREHGQTIVLVTHDARVASAADRVVTLRDGRVADETRLDEAPDAAGRMLGLLQLEV